MLPRWHQCLCIYVYVAILEGLFASGTRAIDVEAKFEEKIGNNCEEELPTVKEAADMRRLRESCKNTLELVITLMSDT